MFCPQIPGSVSTITAGECPEVSLNTSSAFTLTDGIWNSQGLACQPSRQAVTPPPSSASINIT